MLEGSPALPAGLNSSGNCFEECSKHKGFITHPLPSSARAQLTLSMLFEAGLHHSSRPSAEHPAKLLAPYK